MKEIIKIIIIMTVPEFFGCTFLAFGPPLAMFTFTIAHDPIRIIILVAAAFFWLCSLLISSFVWFLIVPLREFTPFGLIVSVCIQVIICLTSYPVMFVFTKRHFVFI